MPGDDAVEADRGHDAGDPGGVRRGRARDGLPAVVSRPGGLRQDALGVPAERIPADPDGQVVLSSPIILYDHPELAAESPGELYDGTEIDEMLVL